MNKSSHRGSFDPLGITILGVLLVSLLVGTIAVTQRGTLFDIRERANVYDADDIDTCGGVNQAPCDFSGIKDCDGPFVNINNTCVPISTNPSPSPQQNNTVCDSSNDCASGYCTPTVPRVCADRLNPSPSPTPNTTATCISDCIATGTDSVTCINRCTQDRIILPSPTPNQIPACINACITAGNDSTTCINRCNPPNIQSPSPLLHPSPSASPLPSRRYACQIDGQCVQSETGAYLSLGECTATCDPIENFVTLKEDYTSCRNGSECKSGYCGKDPADNTFACLPSSSLQCVPSGQALQAGKACCGLGSYENDTGQVVCGSKPATLLINGQICTKNSDCDSGYCAQSGQPGIPNNCRANPNCSLECINGCYPSTNTCKPYCSSEQLAACGSLCIPSGIGGSCARAEASPLPEGARCDPTSLTSSRCESPTQCIAGRCQLPISCPSWCKEGCSEGTTICKPYCDRSKCSAGCSSNDGLGGMCRISNACLCEDKVNIGMSVVGGDNLCYTCSGHIDGTCNYYSGACTGKETLFIDDCSSPCNGIFGCSCASSCQKSDTSYHDTCGGTRVCEVGETPTVNACSIRTCEAGETTDLSVCQRKPNGASCTTNNECEGGVCREIAPGISTCQTGIALTSCRAGDIRNNSVTTYPGQTVTGSDYKCYICLSSGQLHQLNESSCTGTCNPNGQPVRESPRCCSQSTHQENGTTSCGPEQATLPNCPTENGHVPVDNNNLGLCGLAFSSRPDSQACKLDGEIIFCDNSVMTTNAVIRPCPTDSNGLIPQNHKGQDVCVSAYTSINSSDAYVCKNNNGTNMFCYYEPELIPSTPVQVQMQPNCPTSTTGENIFSNCDQSYSFSTPIISCYDSSIQHTVECSAENNCSRLNNANQCDDTNGCEFSNNQCTPLGQAITSNFGIIVISTAQNLYTLPFIDDIYNALTLLPENIREQLITITLSEPNGLSGRGCGRTSDSGQISLTMSSVCNENIIQSTVHETIHNTEDIQVNSDYCPQEAKPCSAFNAFVNAITQEETHEVEFDANGILQPSDDVVNSIYYDIGVLTPDYELYAQLGSFYVTDPDFLKENFPNTYEVFHDLYGIEYDVTTNGEIIQHE